MKPILEKISKDGVAFIIDESEETVFRIEGEGTTVKLKGREPYEALTSSNLVYEAMLAGKLITEKEFEAY